MRLRLIHKLTMTVQEVAERNEIEPLELLEVAKMLAATAIHQTDACEHNRPHLYDYLRAEVERVTETLCSAAEKLEAQQDLEEADAEAWLGKIPGLRKPGEGGGG